MRLGLGRGSSCRKALLLGVQHRTTFWLDNELQIVTAAVCCCRVCMPQRRNGCLLKPPPCMLGPSVYPYIQRLMKPMYGLFERCGPSAAATDDLRA